VLDVGDERLGRHVHRARPVEVVEVEAVRDQRRDEEQVGPPPAGLEAELLDLMVHVERQVVAVVLHRADGQDEHLVEGYGLTDLRPGVVDVAVQLADVARHPATRERVVAHRFLPSSWNLNFISSMCSTSIASARTTSPALTAVNRRACPSTVSRMVSSVVPSTKAR